MGCASSNNANSPACIMTSRYINDDLIQKHDLCKNHLPLPLVTENVNYFQGRSIDNCEITTAPIIEFQEFQPSKSTKVTYFKQFKLLKLNFINKYNIKVFTGADIITPKTLYIEIQDQRKKETVYFQLRDINNFINESFIKKLRLLIHESITNLLEIQKYEVCFSESAIFFVQDDSRQTTTYTSKELYITGKYRVETYTNNSLETFEVKIKSLLLDNNKPIYDYKFDENINIIISPPLPGPVYKTSRVVPLPPIYSRQGGKRLLKLTYTSTPDYVIWPPKKSKYSNTYTTKRRKVWKCNKALFVRVKNKIKRTEYISISKRLLIVLNGT